MKTYLRLDCGLHRILLAILMAAAVGPAGSRAADRARVIATTDGEVDDRSSMIRFLLYTCDFDVTGIVEVNSKYQKNGHSREKWIEAQLDAYESVLPNLRKHNANYPDAESLRQRDARRQ